MSRNVKQYLGLYIHIPFCKSKCSYCDFYSIVVNKKLMQEYLFALQKELVIYAEKYARDFIIDTIYIGGGTPTVLSPYNVGAIHELPLQKIKQYFSITHNPEITIEANPESLTELHLHAFKKLGINRISLGIQTFNDSILKLIGRLADKKTIIEKIKLIQKHKFDNYSFDLIFGLPKQNFDIIKNDIQTAIQFRPKHLSIYGLIIDKHTPMFQLYQKEAQRYKDTRAQSELNSYRLFPTENELADQYIWIHQFLKKNKFHHYEISNFSLKNCESRHNLKYWNNQPYLGMGASATSTINNHRWQNIDNVKKYITLLNQNEAPIKKHEKLDTKKLFNEKIMLQLRLKKGLNINKLNGIEKQFLQSKQTIINSFSQLKLIKQNKQRLNLSLKGFLVSNEVISQLMI